MKPWIVQGFFVHFQVARWMSGGDEEKGEEEGGGGEGEGAGRCRA